jgi:hypothetical protein
MPGMLRDSQQVFDRPAGYMQQLCLIPAET